MGTDLGIRDGMRTFMLSGPCTATHGSLQAVLQPINRLLLPPFPQLAVVEVDGDDPANTHPEACPEAGEVLRCEILPYDDLLPALVRLCERYGSAEYGTGGSEDGSSVEGAQELGQGHTCGGGMDAGAAGNGARMAGSEMRCVLDARLYALALGLELGRAAGVQDRDREGRGEAGGLAGRQQQQQEQQPQGVLEPGEQLVQVQGGVGNVCSTACVPGPGVAEAGTDTAAVPQSAAGTQGARAAGQAEGEGVVAIAAGPGGGGWRLNDDDVPSAAGWRAAFVAQLEGLDEHEIREIMGEDEQGHAAAANGHVCGGRGGGDVEGGQGDGQGSGGSKGGLGAGRGGVQQVGSGVARVGSGDVGGGSGASGSAVAVASGAGSMGAGEGEAAQGAFPGAAALPNVVRWAALRAMGRDSAAAAPAAAAAGGGGAKDTVPGTRTSHTGGSGHRNGHWRGYGQGGGGGGRERVRARWMEGAGEAAAEGGAGGDDGGGERHGGRRGRRHYRGRQHGGGGGGGPMKPKPRGPPTVGGGGSKRGFAGGNVGPLSKLRGGTAGGGGSSSSWRAMQAASRSLCDVAAWRAWAAADPVASGCGVALAACAVAAGVLAARAAVAGARG